MDGPSHIKLDKGCDESRSTEAFDGGCAASIDNEPYIGVTSENEISKKSGICERCNRIPWKDLLKNPLWWVPDQPEIKEDKAPLKASSCRICNLFAKIIETQKLSENGPYLLRKYRLTQLKNNEVPGLPASNSSQQARMFYLQDSDTDHTTCPQLLITDYQPSDTAIKQRYYQKSNVDMEQVKAWIEECQTSHCLDCVGDAAAHQALRQLRVIDCDQKSIVPAPFECRYVALSYVWGQHKSAFEELQYPPKTIADSIDLTRRLGYQYLWIDRYCIDQTNRIDKHTQVLQMGEIYAAAQVTLIAAAGSDPSYGLPGVDLQPRHVPKSEKIGQLWLTILPRLVQLAEVAESKWASRAWTFQEFHRSRRRLIFTHNQAIFVCNSGLQYEMALSRFTSIAPRAREHEKDSYWARQWLPQCTMVKDYEDRHIKDQAVAGFLESKWTAMDRAAQYLEAYSRRGLTYDTDALDAIAGALDPLRKDSVYHIWGAPIRYAFEDANHRSYRAWSNRISVCFACTRVDKSTYLFDKDTYSLLPTPLWRLSEDEFDPIYVDDLPNPQCVKTPSANSNTNQQAVSETSPRIETGRMALTWYHQTPGRRRQGFPSWSSLGWEGPIIWYRQNPSEQSSVFLSHACEGRLHFPKLSCYLSNFDQAQGESLDSAPPSIELTLRTVHLDVVFDLNEYWVAVELDADYKTLFQVHWDADPNLLETKRLVGALLHSRTDWSHMAFVMVLATKGEVLERVGLVKGPLGEYSDHNSHTRRHDLAPLTRDSKREAAKRFDYPYQTFQNAWWLDIFGNYRRLLIR